MRKIKRRILAALFLLGMVSFLHAQATDSSFFQRLAWRGGENALRFEVTVEEEEEGRYQELLREFTDAFFIEVSLPVGKYRFRVIPHDYLDRPGPATEWMDFEVRAVYRPELDDSLPVFVYVEKDAAYELNISGKNLAPDTEIFLLTNSGTTVVPADIQTLQDGSHARLLFNNSQLRPGEYEIIVRNLNGLEANKKGIIFAYPEQGGSIASAGQGGGGTAATGQGGSTGTTGQGSGSIAASGQNTGSTASATQGNGSTATSGQGGSSTTSSGQGSGSAGITGQGGSTGTTGQGSGSIASAGQGGGGTTATGQGDGSTATARQGGSSTTSSGQGSGSAAQSGSNASTGQGSSSVASAGQSGGQTTPSGEVDPINVFLSAAWMPIIQIGGNRNQNLSPAGAAARLGVTSSISTFASIGMELAASFFAFEAESNRAALQAGIVDVNLLTQMWFPDRAKAFTFRLGGGVALLQDRLGTYLNLGASFLWLFQENLYVEVGLDNAYLITDSPSTYIRPWIGMGYKF